MERLLVYYSCTEPPTGDRRTAMAAMAATAAKRKDRPRVAVVGAGINGVVSAFRIGRALRDVRVTVLADKFPPRTTSDAVAGLWGPTYLGDKQDLNLVSRWAGETYEQWEMFHQTADAPLMGITKLGGYCLGKEYKSAPIWNVGKSYLQDYKELDRDALKRFGPDYRIGKSFSSFTCEAKRLSPYLLYKFYEDGGILRQQKILSLKELYLDYDVVVNCTGLESRYVTPDEDVHPIRGQVARVRAPWMKQFLMDHDNYIIPNIDSVLLGGTCQKGDWNTDIDPKDSRHVLDGCCRLSPNLTKAELLFEWAGLRPGRSSVRLEKEVCTDEGRQIQVIHNYGHGGSGLTLCWGCGGDVEKLVVEHFRSRPSLTPKL